MRQTVKKTNRLGFALQLGLFGGLFWGGVYLALEYFRFTRISLASFLRIFGSGLERDSLWGTVGGWGLFVVFTIIAALLYVFFLHKIRWPWMGIFYGLVWWALIHIWLGPWAKFITPVHKLDINSLTTGMCLFALWGLFIGLSTSFEFTDERQREPVQE